VHDIGVITHVFPPTTEAGTWGEAKLPTVGAGHSGRSGRNLERPAQKSLTRVSRQDRWKRDEHGDH